MFAGGAHLRLAGGGGGRLNRRAVIFRRLIIRLLLLAAFACAPLLRAADAAGLAALRARGEAGDIAAQSILGKMYETGYDGYGAAKNTVEAAKWYRRAAEQGDSDSQFSLGEFYARGVGVPKNDIEAERWFSMAIKQGNYDSEHLLNLGFMYSIGNGVTTDYVKAEKWFRMAALQGNAYAQAALGSMYARGRQGVPKNTAEAVKWYRLAAEQRIATPQTNPGGMFVLKGKKENGHLLLPVAFNIDGAKKTISLLLDTGASYTVIPRSFYGAGKSVSNLKSVGLDTANGRVTAPIVSLGVSVSGLSKTVEVAIMPDDVGLLGVNFFEGYIYTIDIEKESVYLQKR
jgi:TPR repeat protein